jgi:uncharacterized metal-binding protein
MDRRDVTGMGIGSKILQAMHNQATTAVIAIADGCPDECSHHATTTAVIRPGHMVFLGSR